MTRTHLVCFALVALAGCAQPPFPNDFLPAPGPDTALKARPLDDPDPAWRSFVNQSGLQSNPGQVVVPPFNPDPAKAPAEAHFFALVHAEDPALFISSWALRFSTPEKARLYWPCSEVNVDNYRVLIDGPHMAVLLPSARDDRLVALLQDLGDRIAAATGATDFCPKLFHIDGPDGQRRRFPEAFFVAEHGPPGPLQRMPYLAMAALEHERGHEPVSNPGPIRTMPFAGEAPFIPPVEVQLEVLAPPEGSQVLENFVLVFHAANHGLEWMAASGCHWGEPAVVLQRGPFFQVLRTTSDSVEARAWLRTALDRAAGYTEATVICSTL